METIRVRTLGKRSRRTLWLRGSFRACRTRGRGTRGSNTNGCLRSKGGRGMKISIPELSLVLLVGPSGCGKSSFARKHFLPTEVVSSDFCRALVSDNENDQSATGDAFDLLHEIIRKRLARGRLTVVDATNVQPEARKSLIALAKEYHLFA